MTLYIRNWSKHQHFKDRTPPWIKLYRDILDDPDWHDLDGDTAKVLVSLWLIASEDETHKGALPNMRRLAFRLRMKESQLNQVLTKLSGWLYQDDIDAVSGKHQPDAPETETEAETLQRTETEAEKPPRKRSEPTAVIAKPDDVDPQTWADWLALRKAKRAPVTETVVSGARSESVKAGMTLDEFLQVWCRRGSQGLDAGWLKQNERGASAPTGRHSGFDLKNYREGIAEDGTLV